MRKTSAANAGGSGRAGTAKSVSLLFGNLAATRGYVAYVHQSSVVVVPEKDVVPSPAASAHCSIVNEPDGAQIQQVRWASSLRDGELLVVASKRSLQIYSVDGGRLLHVVTTPLVGEDGAVASFRGIATCAAAATEYICAGCSNGTVCLVPLAESGGGGHTFMPPLLSPASAHEIVDLTAGPAPHNDPNRALVCSADASGAVHVHALESDGGWGHCTTFTLALPDSTPSLCTSLRMRGTRLYCAHSTGQVRVYDLVSCTLCGSIAAHSRWINALEVHPTRDDLFATASEDTTIGVWSMNEASGKLAHVAYLAATDWLLTGVAFTGGQDRTHVIASAYDQAALQAWKVD